MFPFDQNKQQMYQQYAQAADQGTYSQIDPAEAAGHLQQFAQNAPPEMQHQAYGQYFQQMPPDQRQQFVQQMPQQYQGQMDPNNPRQMAQGFHQMTQQQPGILQQLMGQGQGQTQGQSQGIGGALGGVMSNPMAKMAVTGLAAFAAKQMLGKRGR